MKNVFRISRWHYFPLYLLLLILLGLSIYFFDTGRDFWSYVLLGISIVVFLILEVAIRFRTLKIGETEVVLRRGIFSIQTKRAHYEDITDTGITQSLIQRILNYGSIGLSTSGTGGVEIVMRAMVTPFKAEKAIRKKIHEHRQSTYHAGTEHRKPPSHSQRRAA